MDPIEQILAQGRTQESSFNGADYYFKGLAANQQQQQINLSRQRLMLEQQQQQNENAKLPYQLEHWRLTNINEHTAGEVGIQQLKAMTQQNEALPKLIDLQLQLQETPEARTSPKILGQLRELSQQFPQAFTPQSYGGQILAGYKGAFMLDQTFQQLSTLQQRMQGTGLHISNYNPKTGDMQFGNDAQLKEPSAAIQNANEIAKLRQALRDETNPAKKQVFADQLSALESQTDKAGFEVQTDPETGRMTRVIYGKGAGTGGAMPAAITTDATKRITSIQDTISQIDSIEQSLRPSDVGVKGYVADKLFDTFAPAFGVNTGDVVRMDNREKINALFEGAKTVVSADKRFSNADREDTKKIFPGTGPLDNYEKNVVMMSALKRIQGKRALIEAANAKLPAPDFAVRLLNIQGVSDAYDSKLLTQQEALSEFKRRQIVEDANK